MINVYYNSYQASRIQCYVLCKENQLVRACHGVSVGGFMIIIIFLQLMCMSYINVSWSTGLIKN
jgi:hypothetical protein